MLGITMTACFAWAHYYALAVSGIAFAILALVHLLRIVYRLEVYIGEWHVQMWVSYIAFIISLLFSVWMFGVSIW